MEILGNVNNKAQEKKALKTCQLHSKNHFENKHDIQKSQLEVETRRKKRKVCLLIC